MFVVVRVGQHQSAIPRDDLNKGEICDEHHQEIVPSLNSCAVGRGAGTGSKPKRGRLLRPRPNNADPCDTWTSAKNKGWGLLCRRYNGPQPWSRSCPKKVH